jgi:hypothetical protein
VQVQAGVFINNSGRIVGLPDAELCEHFSSSSWAERVGSDLSIVPEPTLTPIRPQSNVSAAAATLTQQEQDERDVRVAASAAASLVRSDRVLCAVLVCAERDPETIGEAARS